MKTKKLSLLTAISIVIGSVIGSGVFVKPGKVLAATGSSNMAILAWVLGGVISLAGGLTLSEIASRIDRTGGVYAYLEELYSKRLGFLCGWVQSIIYGPGLMSALALYFSSLFIQFFALDDGLQKPIALITVFLLTVVSVVGTSYSAWVQNSTTFIKLIPIALIIVFGALWGQETIVGVEFPIAGGVGGGMTGLGTAILATLWAYDGWVQVANVAGEIDQPSKNLPKAIIIGLSVIMIAYVLVNIGLFHTLPVTQVAELNERSASVAAELLFGSVGGKLIGLGILVSIFGCLNGTILTCTRVPHAMAEQNAFPFKNIFGQMNMKFMTPMNSILLMFGCSVVMIIGLNPDRITDIAIFSMYLFYCAAFIGIFKLRQIYGIPAKGQYKVPLYPLIPLVAFVGSLYICYSMASGAPYDALISVGIMLLGLPIYELMQKKNNN